MGELRDRGGEGGDHGSEGGHGGRNRGFQLRALLHVAHVPQLINVHRDALLRHLAVRLWDQLDQRVQRHLQPRNVLREGRVVGVGASVGFVGVAYVGLQGLGHKIGVGWGLQGRGCGIRAWVWLRIWI